MCNVNFAKRIAQTFKQLRNAVLSTAHLDKKAKNIMYTFYVQFGATKFISMMKGDYWVFNLP